MPYPTQPPAAEFRPRSEAEWYARENGISIDEAAKRQREQQAIMPQFEILQQTLRQREAGNFTSARMTHKPDWGYELYFKRDPDETLRKYTHNPRFIAKRAPYSRAELEAMSKPWTERFAKHNLTGGWAVDDTYGTAEFMMSVTEEEYRAVADREGWGPVPRPIKLGFAGALPFPSVADEARPFIRTFAHERRSTVIQLEAGFTDKIVLRDGCLRVGNGRGALAMFHRETGIGVDEQGYLVLTDRSTGKSKGRVGEWFSWAGPNGTAPDDPALAELRARCGDGAVQNVGNPESLAQFRARPIVVDTVATQRRVSRQKAWDLLKRCWARQERTNPRRPPDEVCYR